MENGQKQVAALKSSKNWGDRAPAPGWNRKTTTPVGEKRETKLPNKRKNVEPQGKDHTTLPSEGVGSALELPVSISCLINRY
jgi:hypothetical protein